MTTRSDDSALHGVVQLLADKQAIHDVVMRYCRGIDRFDLGAVLACYHHDAEDDHGAFLAPRGDPIAGSGDPTPRPS